MVTYNSSGFFHNLTSRPHFSESLHYPRNGL
jgi:hypothetical protein